MERRHILIEDTDGTDVNFMGYTVSNIRGTPVASLVFTELEQPQIIVPPAPTESWWQFAWRILNTDIFELWRTYGPKSSRSD